MILFIINFVLLLGTCIGFICGTRIFFKKGTALFAQLITCALGCFFLGRLFNIVFLLTGISLPDGFHIGKLGLFGGFLFMFSASFGQMDGLVDGGEKEHRKVRMISLLAPLAIFLIFLVSVFHTPHLETIIINGALCLLFSLGSYFHLKHLLITDVEEGILQSIRKYNLLALFLTFLSTIETVFAKGTPLVVSLIVAALQFTVYITIIPILHKGVVKWIS